MNIARWSLAATLIAATSLTRPLAAQQNRIVLHSWRIELGSHASEAGMEYDDCDCTFYPYWTESIPTGYRVRAEGYEFSNGMPSLNWSDHLDYMAPGATSYYLARASRLVRWGTSTSRSTRLLIAGAGTNSNGLGAWLAELDGATGDHSWQHFFAGPVPFAPTTVTAVASDDERSTTGAGFDYAVGYYFVPSSGSQLGTNAFIEKYDHAGNLQWRREFQGLGLNRNGFLSVSPDGNAGAYAVGFEDDVTSSKSAVVAHYSADGSALWYRRITDALGVPSLASAVRQDGMGTVYVLHDGTYGGVTSFTATGDRIRTVWTDSAYPMQRPIGLELETDRSKGIKGDRLYVYGTDWQSQQGSSAVDCAFVFKMTYTGTPVYGGDLKLPCPVTLGAAAVNREGSIALVGAARQSPTSTSFVTVVLNQDGTRRFDTFYRNSSYPMLQAQCVKWEGGNSSIIVGGCDPTNGSPAIYLAYPAN